MTPESSTTLAPAPTERERPLVAGVIALRGLLRACGGALLTVLVASFVIYTALAMAPGDPVAQILGARATDEQRAALREQLGLNQPVVVRYWHWLIGVLHGDLGKSLTYRDDVTNLLAPRLATTALLVVLASILIVVIGIGLGALGGISHRWRPVVAIVTGVGVAVPGFVAASILISVFAVGLGWFPTFGAGQGLIDELWHLVLPAVALALGWSAYVAQLTTAAVGEQVHKEHVMTAIGRGIGPVTVFRRHVLRNAAMPVLTASGLTVAGLIAGSVVVESAFAIDGVGSLLVKSVLSKDYQVVTVVATLIVVIFVVVTALLDVVQVRLDPRLRQTGSI